MPSHDSLPSHTAFDTTKTTWSVERGSRAKVTRWMWRISPGFGTRLGIAIFFVTLLCLLLVTRQEIVSMGGVDGYIHKADSLILMTGSEILRSNAPTALYDQARQRAVEVRLTNSVGLRLLYLLPYNHPPFEAMLVAEARSLGLPYSTVFALWTVCSLLALAGAMTTLRWAWPLRTAELLLFALVGLTWMPTWSSLMLVQSTSFMLLGYAAGSAALKRGHDGWAGLAWALAAIKPQALPVIILALIVQKRWRALATFALTVAAGTLLAMPFVGWDWPIRYVRFTIQMEALPISPANPDVSQSWAGLWGRLLGHNSFTIALTALVTAASLIIVAWLWRPSATRSLTSSKTGHDAWDRRWAITLFLAILANPHLLPHDLALALVPGAILVRLALRNSPRWWLAWLWLGWAMGMVGVLFSDLRWSPAVVWMIAMLVLLARPRWLFAGVLRRARPTELRT